VQSVLRKMLVVVLVAAAMFSTVRYWASTRHLDRGGDALEGWEARIGPARERLPIRRGTIGYVGEWDVPGVPYAFWDQESEFLLSQYTLAPLVLKKGAAAEWNVAVLSPKPYAAWKRLYGGKFTVMDVGHGVYILHRADAP
jgi:hypothetical protein